MGAWRRALRRWRPAQCLPVTLLVLYIAPPCQRGHFARVSHHGRGAVPGTSSRVHCAHRAGQSRRVRLARLWPHLSIMSSRFAQGHPALNLRHPIAIRQGQLLAPGETATLAEMYRNTNAMLSSEVLRGTMGFGRALVIFPRRSCFPTPLGSFLPPARACAATNRLCRPCVAAADWRQSQPLRRRCRLLHRD